MTDTRADRLDAVIEQALRHRSGRGSAPADLLPAVAAEIAATPQRRSGGGGTHLRGPSRLLLIAAVVALGGSIGIGLVGSIRPGPQTGPAPQRGVGLPTFASNAQSAPPVTVATDQLFVVGPSGDSGWWNAAELADGTVLLVGGVDPVYTVRSGEAAVLDPRSRAIHPTGSLTTPRAEASLTTLRDGRVLVLGGIGQDGQPLTSAEIYDPATGTFSPAAPMRAAGTMHTATLLADGRVLVVGFKDDPRSEIYDPAADAWALGGTTVARGFQTATQLPDGRVLIVGGWGGSQRVSAASELFDPSTNTFTRSGSMRLRRNQHTAVLLDDGRVLVVGGMTNPDGFTLDTEVTTAEIYDPGTGAFQAVAGFGGVTSGRNEAATLPDGRVVVFGHGSGDLPATELFDPKRASSSVGPRLVGNSRVALDVVNGWVIDISDVGIELLVPAGAPRPTWAASS